MNPKKPFHIFLKTAFAEKKAHNIGEMLKMRNREFPPYKTELRNLNCSWLTSSHSKRSSNLIGVRPLEPKPLKISTDCSA